MSSICSGLNVIEASSASIAAAMTGMVLADAGARVIKVEAPGGDRLRGANPSGSLVWDRGKESMVADLRTTEGQEQFRALAADADIVIDAFAPGTTDAWGVGATALTEANRRLIHTSISAFGKDGGYSTIRGYDSLVAAKSGLWERGAFGHRRGPIMYPVPWGSFGSAMQSVAAIMGALLVREQSGRGQRLDATLWSGLEPLDYFVATIVQLMAKRGETVKSDARSATGASRYGVLVLSRDGRIVQTSTLLRHQGRALCEVAGVAHILDEPRFARAPSFDSVDDAQAWEDILVEAFREHDLDYWMPRFLANPDVAFEVAVTSEEGMDHPQIVHNGDVVTIGHPTHGPIRQIGPIGHFSRTPVVPSRPAPQVGQNNGAFSTSPAAAVEVTAAPEHPFSGVTIVEFGYFYAMPYALTLAAALGARVIKLEDENGDPHRSSFGPEVASTKTTAGKESISLDMKTPEGRAIAQQIVANADVFVTGFRSGIAEKFGLGYEETAARNPKLLYVHAAGYGSDGPYAARALYAQAAQAVGGSFGRQVGYWADPEASAGMSPLELQVIVIPRLGVLVDGDSSPALALFAAMSLGIYHQQRTGEGQLLRTSMIAANAWCYSDDFCSYDGKPPIARNDEEYFGTSALDRLYAAAGGTWVCIHIPTDAEFHRLCESIDRPDLPSDARFASAEARAANDRALVAELTATLATRTAALWEAAATAHRAGCVAVNMSGQPVVTSFDPVLRSSGLTVAYEHPLFGEMVRSAPPVRFSETPGKVAPPSRRGEHNEPILAELGYDAEQIRDLEARQVVFPATPIAAMR